MLWMKAVITLMQHPCKDGFAMLGIFFPHCLADEDIDYEVNEILWLSNFFMLSTYSYRFFLSFMIVQIGFQSHVYIVKYYDDQ